MHQFKAALLLYLSSLERKSFVKLKKKIVLLSYQINEHQGLAGDEKLRDVSISYFFRTFVLRITLMLSRTFSEPLMSVSNKHNYKTFSESPPAFLLYFLKSVGEATDHF